MPRDSFDRLNSPILHPRTLDAVFKLKMYCFIGKGTGNFEVIMNARKYAQKHIKLESALCGDANPRRLQRQSCCG